MVNSPTTKIQQPYSLYYKVFLIALFIVVFVAAFAASEYLHDFLDSAAERLENKENFCAENGMEYKSDQWSIGYCLEKKDGFITRHYLDRSEFE